MPHSSQLKFLFLNRQVSSSLRFSQINSLCLTRQASTSTGRHLSQHLQTTFLQLIAYQLLQTSSRIFLIYIPGNTLILFKFFSFQSPTNYFSGSSVPYSPLLFILFSFIYTLFHNILVPIPQYLRKNPNIHTYTYLYLYYFTTQDQYSQFLDSMVI